MDGGTIDRPTVSDLLDAEATPPPTPDPPSTVDSIEPGDEGDGLLPAPA